MSHTAKPLSLRDRIVAALTVPRSRKVLVLINTTRGPRAVPVLLRNLR